MKHLERLLVLAICWVWALALHTHVDAIRSLPKLVSTAPNMCLPARWSKQKTMHGSLRSSACGKAMKGSLAPSS